MDFLQSHFTAFDLLLVVTLIFSMLIGLARGFVREFFGLLAWVGALFLGSKEHHWFSHWISSWIHEPILVKIISHFCFFVFFLIVFLLIAQWLSCYIKNSMAQSIDRSLGIVFGFVRGLGVICAFYIGSLFFVLPEKQPMIVKMSKSYTLLNKSAFFLEGLMPHMLRDKTFFQKSIQELRPEEISAQQLTRELSAPPIIPK
jgi:membrane protein required for colicin V production